MQKLIVKDFSCLKSVNLEVSPLTLIIGPQASGKSVVSKLVYFCTNIILDFTKFVVDYQYDLDALSKHVANDFGDWFPPSAWGAKRFVILFEVGKFSIQIVRISKSDRVRVKFNDDFSKFLTDVHSQNIQIFKNASQKGLIDEFDVMLDARNGTTVARRNWMGPRAIDSQTFIPAGRSFFTSVGKALVAFEHSGILDPITLEFGRRFAAQRERQNRMRLKAIDKNSPAGVLFSEILGGNLRSEGGKEYIQSADGRLIPFSALSSGQQELLPLALVIQLMLPSNLPNPIGLFNRAKTIYIEEPEAHLFPRAQNRLVEILATMSGRRATNLFLTTHSPYVLSKFNNLIKAGLLSKQLGRGAQKALASVVSEMSWLKPGTVNAYAIIEGKLTNIMDDSGLIGADYLDSVSGDIANEFSQLLEIEVCA